MGQYGDSNAYRGTACGSVPERLIDTAAKRLESSNAIPITTLSISRGRASEEKSSHALRTVEDQRRPVCSSINQEPARPVSPKFDIKLIDDIHDPETNRHPHAVG